MSLFSYCITCRARKKSEFFQFMYVPPRNPSIESLFNSWAAYPGRLDGKAKSGPWHRKYSELGNFISVLRFPILWHRVPLLFYRMYLKQALILGRLKSRPTLLVYTEALCIQWRTWRYEYYMSSPYTCGLARIFLKFILANQKLTYSSLVWKSDVTVAQYYMFQRYGLHLYFPILVWTFFKSIHDIQTYPVVHYQFHHFPWPAFLSCAKTWFGFSFTFSNAMILDFMRFSVPWPKPYSLSFSMNLIRNTTYL